MYREFLTFAGIVVIALFMTIHNRNLDSINNAEQHAREHKIERDNLLISIPFKSPCIMSRQFFTL